MIRPLTALTNWPAAWYPLDVMSGQERKVRDAVAPHVDEAFYPSKEDWRRVRGPKKRILVERPLVTGYVFIRSTRRPLWHEFRQVKGFIRVHCTWDGDPIRISDEQIAHLRGMTVEAERLRQSQAEMVERLRLARLPRPGERALMTSGPLEGNEVIVTDIRGDKVLWEMLTGLKGEALADVMERICDGGAISP